MQSTLLQELYQTLWDTFSKMDDLKASFYEGKNRQIRAVKNSRMDSTADHSKTQD